MSSMGKMGPRQWSGAPKPAPKAKARPAPKKPKSQPPPQQLPRKKKAQKPAATSSIRGIFNPHNRLPVPTLVSEGSAFHASGVMRNEVTQAIGTRFMIVCSSTGHSGTPGSIVFPAVPTVGIRTIPTLALGGTAGGPTSGRAMKAGVTIVNSTAALNRGGRVYVLNSNQRVELPAAPSAMIPADWDTMMNEIVAHPKTRALSGSHFAEPKTLVCHPTDQADYLNYGEWYGGITVDNFWSHISIWPGVVSQRRPMSAVYIVFEGPAAVQDYTVSWRAHYYTRWPLDSILGQSQKFVPTKDAKTLNDGRDHAEASGSALHPL